MRVRHVSYPYYQNRKAKNIFILFQYELKYSIVSVISSFKIVKGVVFLILSLVNEYELPLSPQQVEAKVRGQGWVA